jgi:DNA-binding transcriptional MerR regulator
MQLKIGELARRTGLTVRALRHYDEIGLLRPSARADNGYRLYGRDDIARLVRIQSLRRLEVSLGDIATLLERDGSGLGELVDQQLAALQRQIEQATALRGVLAELRAQLHSRTEPTVDQWLVALESMVAGSAYFSGDALARLSAQDGAAADARRREKARLTARLQALMDAGAAPDGAQAMALASQWTDLLLDEADGDEGLLMDLYAMHWNEPALQSLTGVGQAGMQFIAHAMACGRMRLYAAYCSPEEMAVLQQHYARHTDAWPPLIRAVRNGMLRGLAPGSEAMRPLAVRWQALALAKAGGDPGLQARMQTALRNEPALRRGSGIDAALAAYVGEAIHCLASPSAP